MSMDWSAVALLVAQHSGLPAVLVGGNGTILLVAPAAERALGWHLGMVGAAWIDHVAPAAAADARWLLEKARSGALRKLEIEIITARGPARAIFDTCPIGGDGEDGVLLLLEHLAPVGAQRGAAEYDYEVHGIAAGSFRLERVHKSGFEPSAEPARKCYEALHGRSAPCEGCTVSRQDAAARASVRADWRPPHEYELTTLRVVGPDAVHVSVRRVATGSLSAMVQAKLDELAARARLSARERSMLGYLMDGRPVVEIAHALEIRPRTVKFHLSNVLQKLGAQSRTDLIRLVF